MFNSKKIARIDNTLAITAKYDLSALQQKIVLLLVARIDPSNFFEPQSISITEIKNIIGKNWGSAYEKLEAALDDLSKRQVQFNSEVVIGGKRIKFGRINWFQSILVDAENRLEFRFSEDMKPFLLELKEYVRISTDEIVQLKGKHTIRLYQVLKAERERRRKMNETITPLSITVSSLKHLLDLSESYKSNDLKRYVLEPLVKEINEKSNELRLQIQYKKTGRKISHIIFHVSDAQLQLKLENIQLTWAQVRAVRELIKFGVYEDLAEDIVKSINQGNIKGYEDYFIKESIADFCKKVKAKESQAAVFVSWFNKYKIYSPDADQYWVIHDRVHNIIKNKTEAEQENRRIASTMSMEEFKNWYRENN